MLGQQTVNGHGPRISVQVLLESLKVIQQGSKESFREKVYSHPWIYKGEGAAHIVFSFNPSDPDDTGVHFPLQRGNVLRLIKKPTERFLTGPDSKKITAHKVNRQDLIPVDDLLWFQGSDEHSELGEYAFVSLVMSPLIGRQYVFPGMPVPLASAFVNKLEEHSAPVRPEFRKAEAQLDPDSHFGFIMPDLTVFPDVKSTISVEVKPKAGFLPAPDYISAPHTIKKHICRYCMYQRLKFKKGEVENLSMYCPLDLFSGEPERIERALYDIFDSPQNNLKVYQNGNLCYTGKLGGKTEKNEFSPENLEEVLAEAFPQTDGLYRKSLVKLMRDIFVREELLDNLLRAQQLDTMDVEGTVLLYRKLKDLGADGLTQEWDHPHLKPHEDDLPTRKEFLENLMTGNGLRKEDCLARIRDFVISATAKDCSIMISFLPLTQEQPCDYPVITDEKGNRFGYRLAVLDLDPKPLNNMEYWHKSDTAIVHNFLDDVNKLKEEGHEVQSPVFPRCFRGN